MRFEYINQFSSVLSPLACHMWCLSLFIISSIEGGIMMMLAGGSCEVGTKELYQAHKEGQEVSAVFHSTFLSHPQNVSQYLGLKKKKRTLLWASTVQFFILISSTQPLSNCTWLTLALLCVKNDLHHLISQQAMEFRLEERIVLWMTNKIKSVLISRQIFQEDLLPSQGRISGDQTEVNQIL